MANTIVHKRSSSTGITPGPLQLTPGELAINTADGKVFTKKDDGSVVEIGGGAGSSTLASLTDVDMSVSPSDGYGLKYDQATAKWKPGFFPGRIDAQEDVDFTSLSQGNILVYGTSGKWINKSPALVASGYVPGKPTAGGIVMKIVAGANDGIFTLSAGLLDSRAHAEDAATSSSVYSIKRNGSEIGTITFGVGETTGTFSMSAGANFAAGDRLTITAPAVQDATLSDVAITIVGVRA